MDLTDLKKALDDHKLWLHAEGGERFNLHDLHKADLHGANLNKADLCGANLRGADLSNAYLREANLSKADLRLANLCDANLSHANLCEANLCEANLSHADLHNADLRSADLSHANLHETALRNADLCHVNLDFSCWDLSCKSLTVKIDDRLGIQLLYHLLSAVKNSPDVSDGIKEKLLTAELIETANKFHWIGSCPRL